MLRPITVHPRSVLLGLLVAGLAMVTMSQVPQNILHHHPVRVEWGPHPRDMVQIRSGTPYTVPADKIFVVTAIGDNGDGSGGNVRLIVDGQKELELVHVFAQNPPTVAPVASGLSISAGSIIEVGISASSPLAGRVWGYLADE